MMKTFSISVLLDTLVKSPTGAITGKIHVEADGLVFPEYEWNDFVVIILGWWLKEIARLGSGFDKNGSCRFMDGPFEFNIEVSGPERWMVRFVKRSRKSDEYLSEGAIAPSTIIGGVLSASKSVLKLCREKRWTSPEITSLIEACEAVGSQGRSTHDELVE